MEKYAYIRVSTKDQNIDRQLVAIEPYKLPAKNIFCDYQSGKDFKRFEYQRLIKALRSGDLLIIKSIDRLGRNYNEILKQWQYITKGIGADIKVLDMEILDTRTNICGLTGTLVCDLVLQILAYVAQIERESIKQRQAEGIAAAKARGQVFGPKPIKMPADFDKTCISCVEGRLSTRSAAKSLNLSHTTFCRRYRKWRLNNQK